MAAMAQMARVAAKVKAKITMDEALADLMSNPLPVSQTKCLTPLAKW